MCTTLSITKPKDGVRNGYGRYTLHNGVVCDEQWQEGEHKESNCHKDLFCNIVGVCSRICFLECEIGYPRCGLSKVNVLQKHTVFIKMIEIIRIIVLRNRF